MWYECGRASKCVCMCVWGAQQKQLYVRIMLRASGKRKAENRQQELRCAVLRRLLLLASFTGRAALPSNKQKIAVSGSKTKARATATATAAAVNKQATTSSSNSNGKEIANSMKGTRAPPSSPPPTQMPICRILKLSSSSSIAPHHHFGAPP